MNANELADALEKDPMRWTILENAITMLRQQQAEIEVLKTENQELSALCVEFNVLRKAQ